MSLTTEVTSRQSDVTVRTKVQSYWQTKQDALIDAALKSLMAIFN